MGAGLCTAESRGRGVKMKISIKNKVERQSQESKRNTVKPPRVSLCADQRGFFTLFPKVSPSGTFIFNFYYEEKMMIKPRHDDRRGSDRRNNEYKEETQRCESGGISRGVRA